MTTQLNSLLFCHFACYLHGFVLIRMCYAVENAEILGFFVFEIRAVLTDHKRE